MSNVAASTSQPPTTSHTAATPQVQINDTIDVLDGRIKAIENELETRGANMTADELNFKRTRVIQLGAELNLRLQERLSAIPPPVNRQLTRVQSMANNDDRGSFISLSKANENDIDEFIRRMMIQDEDGELTDIATQATIDLNDQIEFEPFTWPPDKTEPQAQPDAQRHFIRQLKKVQFPANESYDPLIEENLITGTFKCIDTHNNKNFIKISDAFAKYRGGCDALIVPTSVRGAPKTCLTQCRIMLEFKKSQDLFKMGQFKAEYIGAAMTSSHPVLGVLTDLSTKFVLLATRYTIDEIETDVDNEFKIMNNGELLVFEIEDDCFDAIVLIASWLNKCSSAKKFIYTKDGHHSRIQVNDRFDLSQFSVLTFKVSPNNDFINEFQSKFDLLTPIERYTMTTQYFLGIMEDSNHEINDEIRNVKLNDEEIYSRFIGFD